MNANLDQNPGDATASERIFLLMRPDEKGVVVLCHLITIVPLWALVANALLLFLYRQSSRAVCFHATQGIHFQILLLMVSVPVFLLLPLEKLLKVAQVSPALAGALPAVAEYVLTGLLVVYAFFCLVGAFQALRGKVFKYPLVGRSVYRSFQKGTFAE